MRISLSSTATKSLGRFLGGFAAINSLVYTFTRAIYGFCWVDGGSMRPTINANIHLPQHRTYCGVHKFNYKAQRGDVVNAYSPSKEGKMIVKRIIALEGDYVKSRRTNLIVQIPSGHCWLEGDNERASYDSNDYGPVPTNLILGRVDRVIIPQQVRSLPVNPRHPSSPAYFCAIPSLDIRSRRATRKEFLDQEYMKEERLHSISMNEKKVKEKTLQQRELDQYLKSVTNLNEKEAAPKSIEEERQTLIPDCDFEENIEPILDAPETQGPQYHLRNLGVTQIRGEKAERIVEHNPTLGGNVPQENEETLSGT